MEPSSPRKKKQDGTFWPQARKISHISPKKVLAIFQDDC